MISFIRRCYETETRPIEEQEAYNAIKTGDHGLKPTITQIRNKFESELVLTGSLDKAKKLVAPLKNELPGFIITGLVADRSTGSLVDYTGRLCADLDNVPEEEMPRIKEWAKGCIYVRAVFRSPTDGLKIVFNVVKDPARHEDSFRAIKQFVLDWTGLEIDPKCKDLPRICYFSYDPDLWVREEGNEVIEPADPIPVRPKITPGQLPPDLNAREQIAYRLVGELRPSPEKGGYFVDCPGQHLHTNKTADKHTILYLENVPTLKCQHGSCEIVVEAFNKLLRSEIGKAENLQNSPISYPLRDMRYNTNIDNPNGEKGLTPEKPLIEFCTQNDLENYTPPDGILLIGDYHIVKDTGFVFVIGGPPGAGKSLGLTSLAVAGATGEGEWFGMTVHRKFKTMIIQTENGMFRLSRNFKELTGKDLQDYVRISKPPPYGMIFKRQDFRFVVRDCIAEFGADILALDPWNAAARDQEQSTYLETFELTRSVLPVDTVLGIVAHTRKPQTEQRSSGRALMHLLAGSYVLTSCPRSIFVLQYASDDVEDDQVVWTCCKNNDGELGPRTAWHRKVGLFEPVPDFDWDEFDSIGQDKRFKITKAMVELVFDSGEMLLADAVEKLAGVSNATNGACYKALSKDGRFADQLVFNGKFVKWVRK